MPFGANVGSRKDHFSHNVSRSRVCLTQTELNQLEMVKWINCTDTQVLNTLLVNMHCTPAFVWT